MQPTGDGTSQIAHIPDRPMEDFIHVIQHANEHVVMLRNLTFACRPGLKVRILRGPFQGVVGIVKSIQKHISVVLTLGDLMAVAILNVPKKDIEPVSIDDVDTNSSLPSAEK